MTKNQQVLITTTEAAARLFEDKRTVQRKAKSGAYPAFKLPGIRGAYVFTPAQLAKIIRQRQQV